MSPEAVRSIHSLRKEVAARLRARKEEIHEAVIHRALSVAPPSGKEAPGYVEALRNAIPSAVDYAIAAIEEGEERIGPPPAAVFAQTAASAHSRVGLEVVLRRYAAGYSTLCDHLGQEILAAGGLAKVYAALQRDLTAIFDRLVVEVSEVYRREEARSLSASRRRRTERIRRLMAGEMIDPVGLDYPLGGFHLAVIALGTDPEAALTGLAQGLDRRLLLEDISEDKCAGWLGGPRQLEASEVVAATRSARSDLQIAIGEPGQGPTGWRRTRRQAEAAHLVARRKGAGVVAYREVALLAAALRDPDLAHFLTETFRVPLEEDRLALRETLAAFLEASWNASSAAAALGVTRHTITSRLRVVEERLGRPLVDCAPELETALRLHGLEA